MTSRSTGMHATYTCAHIHTHNITYKHTCTHRQAYVHAHCNTAQHNALQTYAPHVFLLFYPGYDDKNDALR
jgi:hypothetical protein